MNSFFFFFFFGLEINIELRDATELRVLNFLCVSDIRAKYKARNI